jgi:hypothetical protein
MGSFRQKHCFECLNGPAEKSGPIRSCGGLSYQTANRFPKKKSFNPASKEAFIAGKQALGQKSWKF